MTDLTELWKKGKLPEGYYYVKDGDNMIAEYLDGYFYNDGVPMTSFSGGVDEVLAPVPSYEEWQAKLEENERLKHDVGNLGYKIKNQRKEIERQIAQNAKLKELLKECAHYVNHRFLETRETLTKPYTASDKVLHKKAEKLLQKIDEVLK